MIVSYPEAAVPADLRTAARALREQAWPGPGGDHDPALDPVTMLLVEEGRRGHRVLAVLDILSKTIEHNGQTLAAPGLSAVVTDHTRRREGHGLRLARAAHAAIRDSGVDIGLFTCDSPLRTFYERAGWSVLPGTVLIGGTREAPLPSDGPGFDKVTLGDFFTARGQRVRASFVDARIALYPGDIDRLW